MRPIVSDIIQKKKENAQDSTYHNQGEGLHSQTGHYETLDHIKLSQSYEERPLKDHKHLDQYSGFAPFMRGPYTTMYRTRGWTRRQDLVFGSVEETNEHWKTLIAQGIDSLTLNFDHATHRGYDSDHDAVLAPDIGRGGVALDSLHDMRILFDGISLDQVSVSFVINSSVLPVMAFYIALAKERGFALASLRGTLQNDILQELLLDQRHIYPAQSAMRIATDVMKYSAEHLPYFFPLCVNGHLLREAGSHIEMELAYSLASGVAYLRAGIDAGLDLDDFAVRTAFSFGVGMNFYAEIAKHRAARLLWAKLVKKLGAKDNRALALKSHSQTLKRGLTATHQMNNVVRTAVEAVSAVFGQTQSLHTSAMDVLEGSMQANAAKIAEDTQFFLEKEFIHSSPIDPLAGSYCIEQITYEIAERTWKLLGEIESHGGMVKAIENGFPALRIEEARSNAQARLDAGFDIVVGGKPYQNLLHDGDNLNDEESLFLRGKQAQKLREHKKRRSQREVLEALRGLRRVARDTKENLLEAAIHAAEKGATLGEMTQALEDVYGRSKITMRPVYGESSAQLGSKDSFTAATAMAMAFHRKYGRRPRLYLAKLGREGYGQLMQGIAVTFASIGFDVDMAALLDTTEDLVRQALQNDVHVIGVSFLSNEYKVLIPKLIAELNKHSRNDILVIAGGVIAPLDFELLLDAGVFAIFGPGTVMTECAQEILQFYLDLPEE